MQLSLSRALALARTQQGPGPCLAALDCVSCMAAAAAAAAAEAEDE